MDEKKMKVLKSKEEIPKEFESLEAEAEFYDTHDFGEILDLTPLKTDKKQVKRHYYSKEEKKHA